MHPPPVLVSSFSTPHLLNPHLHRPLHRYRLSPLCKELRSPLRGTLRCHVALHLSSTPSAYIFPALIARSRGSTLSTTLPRLCCVPCVPLGSIGAAAVNCSGREPVSALDVEVVLRSTDSAFAVDRALHGRLALAKDVSLLSAEGAVHVLEHRAVTGPRHHGAVLRETQSRGQPRACAVGRNSECTGVADPCLGSRAWCGLAGSNYG